MTITDNAIERAMTGPMIGQIWTDKDIAAAELEGWEVVMRANLKKDDLFHGGWSIRPIDRVTSGGKRFPARSREEIIFHIVDKALNNSELHLKVLAFIGAKALHRQQNIDS